MARRKNTDKGYPLPSVIEVDSFLCLQVQIPDRPEYRAAAVGAITTLGQWWNWQRTNDEGGKRAAEIWRKTIFETLRIAESCPTDMDCEDIADCVESELVINNDLVVSINNAIGGGSRPYQPLFVTTQRDFKKPAIPQVAVNCDLDKLFFKVRGTFDILNDNNIDFFEEAEVNSNLALEFGSIIASLVTADTSQFNTLFEFVNYVSESVVENYNSALTDEYRDLVTCEIFCEFKEDCGGMTLEWLRDYFVERVAATFDFSTPLAAVESLTDYLVNILDGAYENVNTVDVFMVAQLVFLTTLNGWANPSSQRATSRLLTQIAVLDGSDNDWQILCDDCPSEIYDIQLNWYANDPPYTLTRINDRQWLYEFAVGSDNYAGNLTAAGVQSPTNLTPCPLYLRDVSTFPCTIEYQTPLYVGGVPAEPIPAGKQYISFASSTGGGRVEIYAPEGSILNIIEVQG